MGKHESVIRQLIDNGAKITSGDVGQFACTAAEQNNITLLKEIVRLGGDVTSPKLSGSTALHLAVCEGNIEIVKFLLEQGADIDKTDEHGWTSRDLAEQQGHEDIKTLFESIKEDRTEPVAPIIEERHGVRFLGKYRSDPAIVPVPQEGPFSALDGSWGRGRRRKTDNFYNSLFGVMSAAQNGDNDLLLSVNQASRTTSNRIYVARVTISCPEKGDVAGRLVLLPHSFQELREIGLKKCGFLPARVLNKDGAEIDEIELIRDGDHLVFVSDGRIIQEPNQQNADAILR